MNVTWPSFRTMHICVGRELIISFYLKLLRPHPHSNYTPQTFINISFWRCTTDPPWALCGFSETPLGRLDSQSFLQNSPSQSSLLRTYNTDFHFLIIVDKRKTTKYMNMINWVFIKALPEQMQGSGSHALHLNYCGNTNRAGTGSGAHVKRTIKG